MTVRCVWEFHSFSQEHVIYPPAALDCDNDDTVPIPAQYPGTKPGQTGLSSSITDHCHLVEYNLVALATVEKACSGDPPRGSIRQPPSSCILWRHGSTTQAVELAAGTCPPHEWGTCRPLRCHASGLISA